MAAGAGMHDVVVVGSGAAGLATAIAARAHGLTSIVLEKAPLVGGGTAISSGYLWVGGNHLNPDPAGDSAEDVLAYLRHVGADGIDEARMQAFAATAPQALRFFEAQGIPFRITGRLDHYHGVAPCAKSGGRIVETPAIDVASLGAWRDRLAVPAGVLYRLSGSELGAHGGPNAEAAWQAAEARARAEPWRRGGGAGLVGWLLQKALGLGVAFETGTAAARLRRRDGRVDAVISADGREFPAGSAVVLASGGYESSDALVRNFEALPGWQSMFPETLTGDGLVMAAELGALVRIIPNNLSIFLGLRNPEEAPGGVATCRLSANQELVARHTMVVNREGRRFVDETFFQAVAPSLRHFDVRQRRHANLPCFLVFDSQYAAANSFAGRPPGAAIPDWVARADTPQVLAGLLGIDPAGLAGSLDRFNADVRAGRDRAFRRGETPWGLTRIDPSVTLGTIEVPPFRAIELHPTALSSAGLAADAAARVLDVRGRVMPGLFAVGNAAARTETGSGYQTGYSLASALTFGLIAARGIAAG